MLGRILERGINFREFCLERGVNLESRVAHTHPKNTQVPPPRFSGLSVSFVISLILVLQLTQLKNCSIDRNVLIMWRQFECLKVNAPRVFTGINKDDPKFDLFASKAEQETRKRPHHKKTKKL